MIKNNLGKVIVRPVFVLQFLKKAFERFLDAILK